MSTEVITPNKAKTLRRLARDLYRDARSCLARARRLRSVGGVLAAEEADGEIDMARHWRTMARIHSARLRASRVEKYSNLSAAARHSLEGRS